MISTETVSLSFSGNALFEDVSVKFLGGNCYGLIGANGAGKSTFLKILSGEIDSTTGNVHIDQGKRLAVLKQDQFAFDNETVLNTVLMGDKALYDVYKERQDLYEKTDLTEEEGLKVAELEETFAELDGYSAEGEAAGMLNELGLDDELHDKKMSSLEANQKIRVLLAQALFNNPDILLLDEPTNQLDYQAKIWLEEFLLEFKNTVIVISHDRHFLNKVCTHIADLDFKKVTLYVGNYAFWLQASQLAAKQKQDSHKKATEKIAELEEFVRRFSANASKSKQATSRKKLIEKIKPEEIPTSSRRSPFIHFKSERPCGNNVLNVENLNYSLDGQPILKDITFRLEKGEKLAITGENTLSKTCLLNILAGNLKADSGHFSWGETITSDYFPKDNSAFFNEPQSLFDWLFAYYQGIDTQEVRGLLGRMLFSGDDVEKKVGVLSGGEKARAMFSKLMLSQANVLLFDEPTDHLDLESISALNEGLKNFKEGLIFTSHDIQLLDTVANRIIEVGPTGMISYLGNFSDYMTNSTMQNKRKELALA